MIPGTNETKDFDIIPSGLQLARCIWVVDMGTQPRGKFGPKATVLLGFELPELEIEVDGETKPRVKSIQETCSLNEKANLTKHIASWRGKPLTKAEAAKFNLKQLLDSTCQLNIVHAQGSGQNSDKTYANIQTIVPVGKGVEVPDRHHDLLYFSLSMFDQEVFEQLPEWTQEKIKESPEYQRATGAYEEPITPWTDGIDEEDIPF